MTAPGIFRVPDDDRCAVVYRCPSCGAWSPHELWHRDRCPICGGGEEEVLARYEEELTDGR